MARDHQWRGVVKTARREPTAHCHACNGTGKRLSRSTGGIVSVGVCFRCRGKGYQDEADQRRNQYYDRHVRRMHG